MASGFALQSGETLGGSMARIGWRGVFPAVTTQFREEFMAEAMAARPVLKLAAE